MGPHQGKQAIAGRIVTALLGLLVSAGGCAKTSVEIGVTTRAQTYEGFGEPMELATAEPHRMAVLPVVTGGGERIDAANMSMSEALDYDYRPFTLLAQEEKPELTVIRFNKVVNTCIAAGDTGILDTVTNSLRQSGIPDRDAILRLGEMLEVEYLLVPKLVNIRVDNAGRFTFTGLTFIRTGWISIEAAMQLWHAPTGELVWQSTGEGSLTAENVVGISPPVQSALDGIMITLFGDFVTGRSQAVVRTSVQQSGGSSSAASTAPPPVVPKSTEASVTTETTVPPVPVPTLNDEGS